MGLIGRRSSARVAAEPRRTRRRARRVAGHRDEPPCARSRTGEAPRSFRHWGSDIELEAERSRGLYLFPSFFFFSHRHEDSAKRPRPRRCSGGRRSVRRSSRRRSARTPNDSGQSGRARRGSGQSRMRQKPAEAHWWTRGRRSCRSPRRSYGRASSSRTSSCSSRTKVCVPTPLSVISC